MIILQTVSNIRENRRLSKLIVQMVRVVTSVSDNTFNAQNGEMRTVRILVTSASMMGTTMP
jgi:hypothetical protein